MGPKCCVVRGVGHTEWPWGENDAGGGTHRRNRAHDPTSDCCQLPPKKRGVGSVWDSHFLFCLFLLSFPFPSFHFI